MVNIVVAAKHDWNIRYAEALRQRLADCGVTAVNQKDELNSSLLQTLNPKYIFFPHWSWNIPSEIYEKYTCIVFHMTDLPYGRGGSPLQNLISRGVAETQISAIRVCGELDAGDVYVKEPLSLYGGAEEIYIRASGIIFDKMIPYIVECEPTAEPQTGEIVCFKRRTPEMSRISPDMTIGQMFDCIRMLDAEGYPKAYIEFGQYKFSFSRPKLTSRGIIADVEMEESE